MFSVRSLISAAGGTASRMIGTYVNYPTNRPSRTPLSSFLRRCALSTTPNGDTSGSNSTKEKKKIEEATSKLKVDDNTINIPIDIPRVNPSSSLSADLGTVASVKSSLNKPVDRDERMADLEESIESKEVALVSLSNEIKALADERRVLLKSPESSRDGLLLKSFEDDLSDMRKREDRLAAEILELKTELSALKNPKEPAGAPVSAQVRLPLVKFLEVYCDKEKTSFPSSANPVEILLFPSFLADLPRQGRKDILDNFWDEYRFMTRPSWDENKGGMRNPILVIHSSPGCGKTYILREIGRKNHDGVKIPVGNLQKLKFVPISFNGATSISQLEATFKATEYRAFSLVFPRLLHSLFVCDSKYVDFLGAFHYHYGNDYENLLTELKALIKVHFPDKFLVVLVDEISKVDLQVRDTRSNELSESARSLICSYCNFDGHDIFHFSVFTSLNMDFINKAQRHETISGRPIKSIGRLSMLSIDETQNLLVYFLSKNKIALVKKDGSIVNKRLLPRVLKRAATIIHSTSGGHPRSIDMFFRHLGDISSAKISIGDILKYAIKMHLHHMKKWCIKAAIIGKSAEYKDIVPSADYSFDVAISDGYLIGSNLAGETYRPFVSEMMILKYLSQPFEDVLEKKMLNDIMDCRKSFTHEVFEQFVYLREILLSKYRYDESSLNKCLYKSVPVSTLFAYGLRSSDGHDDAFQINIDRSKILEVTSFEDIKHFSSINVKCGVLVPESSLNEAFDFVIRYPIADRATLTEDKKSLLETGQNNNTFAPEQDITQPFVEIFYQIKYKKDSSKKGNKINIATILKCHSYCKSVARFPNRFIFVMLGWREKCKNITAKSLPENTIVLDKQSVSDDLGPTFDSFIHSQDLSSIWFQRQD